MVRTVSLSTLVLAILVSASAHADDVPEEPSSPGAPSSEERAAPAVPSGEEPTPSPAPKRKVGLIGRLHGGVGQRRLFDSSVLGADLTAGIGAYTEHVNVYVDMQLLFASSGGLPVRHYLFGPSVDFEPFSRVRLGTGLAVGGTTITRASGGTLSAFSMGARIFASVDVWTLEEHGGFYLLGQLSVDSAGTLFADKTRGSVPVTALWGPTIAAGVRF